MAIAFVRELTASTSSSATTLVYTAVTGSLPVAGNLLVLSAVTSGSRTISSIVDSRSNTYAVADFAAFGTSCTGFVAYSLLATSLQNGDTITITWSSTANSAVNISEWSGIAASPLDKTANANSIGTNSVSTFTVGPTATTTQADELVVAAFGYVGSNSGTAGSGYTLLTRAQSTGTNRSVHAEYKIVAATGTQTATMDINVASSGGTGMAVATFKAAAGGGTTFTQSVSGTLTTAGGLVRRTNQVKAGTLTSAGTLAKRAAISPAGTLTTTGTLAAVKVAVLALAGTLTTAGAVVRRANKALAGTLTSAGALAKLAKRSFTGTLTTAGGVAKQVGKALAGTLTTGGALTPLLVAAAPAVMALARAGGRVAASAQAGLRAVASAWPGGRR